METEKSVLDGVKLTDEQLGKLQRKFGEIIKRANDKTTDYQDILDVLQYIIIEGKSREHLGVIRKTHEIKPIDHAVDCGDNPQAPFGWSIQSNKVGKTVRLEKHEDGQLYGNGKKIVLFLSEKQNIKPITGNKLQDEVSGKDTLNLIMLRYLLENPELIPKDWRYKVISFWGTIICNPEPCIPCLFWTGSQWGFHHTPLSTLFTSDNQAAVFES